MTKNSTLLIFGLDGATWKILNPLLSKNKLPFLKSLISKGRGGILESTIPPLTSTAWASFQTGFGPEKHGIWGFFKPNGELFSSKDIKQPGFFKTLSKKGKSCALINLPLTYPIKKIKNCLIVSSFLTPRKKDFAYPKSIQKELKKLDYKIDLDFKGGRGFGSEEKLSQKEKKELHQQILNLVKSRERAALHILDKKPWNLFFTLFKASDLTQHYFWNKKETLKTYQAIDQAIKKIVSKYKKLYPQKKVNILIISDHGFHPSASKDICFYPLLRSLNILPAVSFYKLRCLRGLRKIFKFKDIENSIKLDKIKVWDYGLDWPAATHSELLKLAANLRNLKLKNKRVFQQVKLIDKIPGKIIWLTQPDFAPNSDPLSEKVFYPKKTGLLAHHYSDPQGIFITTGKELRVKTNKLKITDLSKLILKTFS